MADARFLHSPAGDAQWRESALSTRSLSDISNASHSRPHGGRSRQTSVSNFPAPSRTNTIDTMLSSDDGDLEMANAKRADAVGLPEISELPDSVAHSLLFELPREIRDRIYTLLLSPRDGVAVEWPRHVQCRVNTPYHLQAQLLQTCRIVHEEAAPLLYTLSNMSFHHPSDANVFVRAFADPIHGRQISHLSLHIKAQDSRTWMPYLTSADEVRSLKADFPSLTDLGVRFRSSKWQHLHPPEQNLRAWHDDLRLGELIDGLRHVYLRNEPPERDARGRGFQTSLTSSPAAIRDGDPDQLWDGLLRTHRARLDRTSSLPRITHSAPTIRVVCACRVSTTHFQILTTRALDPLSALGESPHAPPPVPVREGEPFRGFTAVDLQTEFTQQPHDPVLGSAALVARTPHASTSGILLSLEIHCLDHRRHAAEREQRD